MINYTNQSSTPSPSNPLVSVKAAIFSVKMYGPPQPVKTNYTALVLKGIEVLIILFAIFAIYKLSKKGGPGFLKKLILALIILFVIAFLFLLIGSDFFAAAAKPVIYLYPANTTNVYVSIKIPYGYLTVTTPAIGPQNNWNVIAEPGSKILSGGKQYPYLFYESFLPWTLSINRGWVVKGSNVTNWFGTNLPKMGLNANETYDFVSYWSQHLPSSNYYLISLLNSSQLDSTSIINITPKPNTTINVILVIQKLDSPIIVATPNFTVPQRKGFTAVQWGVILRNFSN